MKNKLLRIFTMLIFILIFSFKSNLNVYASQEDQHTTTEVSVILKRTISGTPYQIVESNKGDSSLPKTNNISNEYLFFTGIFILLCLVYLYFKTKQWEEI